MKVSNEGPYHVVFDKPAGLAEVGAMADALYRVYGELFPNRHFRTYKRSDGTLRVRDTRPQHITPDHRQIACVIERRYVYFQGRMAGRVKSDFMKQLGIVGESGPVADDADWNPECAQRDLFEELSLAT
jgi:hypothetical protein